MNFFEKTLLKKFKKELKTAIICVFQLVFIWLFFRKTDSATAP